MRLAQDSFRDDDVQVSYCEGPYDTPEGFRKLLVQMQEYEKPSKARTWGRLFYLALPPSVYLDVLTNVRYETKGLRVWACFVCATSCRCMARQQHLCGATATQVHVLAELGSFEQSEIQSCTPRCSGGRLLNVPWQRQVLYRSKQCQICIPNKLPL